MQHTNVHSKYSVSDSNKTRLSPLTKQSRTIRSQTYEGHCRSPNLLRQPKSLHHARHHHDVKVMRSIACKLVTFLKHENFNHRTDFVSPVHSGRREHEC